MGLKEYLEQRKKEKAESKSYAKIVQKRTLQLRREAYAKEAEKQATLKGQRMAIEHANRPTFGQRLAGVGGGVAKAGVWLAKDFAGKTTAPRRASVKRRTVRYAPRRARVKRRSIRYAPRRRSVRRQPIRYAPRRRSVRRQPVQRQPSQPSAPKVIGFEGWN